MGDFTRSRLKVARFLQGWLFYNGDTWTITRSTIADYLLSDQARTPIQLLQNRVAIDLKERSLWLDSGLIKTPI